MNNVVQMNKPELNSFIFNTQQVRTILIDGEPWFVLNDLCRVLGIANPSNVADRIDPLTLRKAEVENSRGQMRETVIVNEAGMYEVVIRANGELARTFRRWITSEVLPAIRKTGSYSAPKSLEEQTLEIMGALQARVAEQAQELETARPLAAQAQTYREADGLRTLTDLTNDLKVHAASNYPGRKVLRDNVFDLAGELGLIIRGNTVRNNEPTARAIEAAWVKPKITVVETNNHGSYTKRNAHLTNRGYGRVWDEAVTRLRNNQPIFTPKAKVA